MDLKTLEKEIVRSRIFDRLKADAPDGFPFEARLKWRRAVEEVFEEVPIDRNRYDRREADLEEKLLAAFGEEARAVAGILVAATRRSLDEVLRKNWNR